MAELENLMINPRCPMAAVARLVQDGEIRVADAGPLRRAQQLEALGFLRVTLQEALGTGYRSAVKFLA